MIVPSVATTYGRDGAWPLNPAGREFHGGGAPRSTRLCPHPPAATATPTGVAAAAGELDRPSAGGAAGVSGAAGPTHPVRTTAPAAASICRPRRRGTSDRRTPLLHRSP